MKRNNVRLIYIVGVILYVLVCSNLMYSPAAYLPIILVLLGAIVLGGLGVYLFTGNLHVYRNLVFISYLLTIAISFIPKLGVSIIDGNNTYGFPLQWLTHYRYSGGVLFDPIGFTFNLLIIYFILRFLSNKLKPKQIQSTQT